MRHHSHNLPKVVIYSKQKRTHEILKRIQRFADTSWSCWAMNQFTTLQMNNKNEIHCGDRITGLFCRGGKIDGRLLKFCQSHDPTVWNGKM